MTHPKTSQAWYRKLYKNPYFKKIDLIIAFRQNIMLKNKLEYVTEIFEWVKWKSIFIKDPESNILEFVCHDPDI